MAQRQLLMRLLVAFGGIATALALLGIYGVMAYAVSQRTREIGIRVAIGARPSDVARLIVHRGLAMTTAGVIVGIVTAIALSHLIRRSCSASSPQIRRRSPRCWMLGVAAVAAYVPARRAARVDPASALRT